MEDSEIRTLIRDTTQSAVSVAIAEAVPAAVKQTLEALGFDVANPRETQADMACLRDWRQTWSTVRRHAMVVSVTVALTGTLYMIWDNIKN